MFIREQRAKNSIKVKQKCSRILYRDENLCHFIPIDHQIFDDEILALRRIFAHIEL